MSKPLANVQALRAVAAVLVVFAHFDVILPGLGLPMTGHGAVDLFFAISGFVMVWMTKERRPTPWAFMRDRVLRIVPLYWLMTILTFGTAMLAPRILKNTTADWGDLARSLFFIAYLKPSGAVQPLLFVGWTLNCEMLFYLLFTVGLAFKLRAVGYAVTLGALLALVVAGRLLPGGNPVLVFYTSPGLLNFGVGMLLALSVPTLERFTSGGAWRLPLVGLLAISLAALPLIEALLPFAAHPVLLFGPAAAVALTCAVLTERHRIVFPAWAATLGNASYSMYLIHPFVVQAFQSVAVRLHIDGFWLALIGALCLAAVAGSAVVTYRFVEQPLTAAVKALFTSAPRRTPAVP